MNLRLVATAAVLLLPPLSAQASDICQALQRRLATLPQVIGSTADVRRHAELLRQHDDEIRYLRTELRRAGCGSGSIVSYGAESDLCSEITADLRETEMQRDTVAAQGDAARQIVRPSGERNAIMAALDANGCVDDDAAPVPVAVQPDRMPGIEAERPASSSITTLTPKIAPVSPAAIEAQAPPPPPERPYDPSRKVRSVGPVFLPDESAIDLANPATGGAKPGR